MFEVIPLKFIEKEKGCFEAESVFGAFKIWELEGKNTFKFKSLNRDTKRFYIGDFETYSECEKTCQKNYKSFFKGLIRELKE